MKTVKTKIDWFPQCEGCKHNGGAVNRQRIVTRDSLPSYSHPDAPFAVEEQSIACAALENVKTWRAQLFNNAWAAVNEYSDTTQHTFHVRIKQERALWDAEVKQWREGPCPYFTNGINNDNGA